MLINDRWANANWMDFADGEELRLLNHLDCLRRHEDVHIVIVRTNESSPWGVD